MKSIINSKTAFARFNLLNLSYTLLVILWGAFVRASGSGAGCGDHWPLCNGEVIPTPEKLQTLIEFAHRATSGISLILVVLGFLWALKLAEKHSMVRRVAFITVMAIILEALLGAALVLLKLVEFDQSLARVISISLHLVNTLFLLASVTTLTYISRELKYFGPMKERFIPRSKLFWSAAIVFAVLGVTGAITALGDTLFPSATLMSGMAQDFKPGAHFLVRLRAIHPFLAMLWIGVVFTWSRDLETLDLKGIRALLLGLVITQFLVGFLNWALMAPNTLQLLHLLVADLVFISLWISGLKYETRESCIQA